MFKYFKSKAKLYRDSFNEGYKRAEKITKKLWQHRLDETKSRAKDIIKERDRKLKKLDKRVDDIDRTLEDFMFVLSEVRSAAIQKHDKKFIEHQDVAEEYREVSAETQKMLSLYRKAKNGSEQIKKSIEKYKMTATLQ